MADEIEQTGAELHELMRKYALPVSTNKAALQRVMDRLGGGMQDASHPQAERRKRPKDGRGRGKGSTGGAVPALKNANGSSRTIPEPTAPETKAMVPVEGVVDPAKYEEEEEERDSARPLPASTQDGKLTANGATSWPRWESSGADSPTKAMPAAAHSTPRKILSTSRTNTPTTAPARASARASNKKDHSRSRSLADSVIPSAHGTTKSGATNRAEREMPEGCAADGNESLEEMLNAIDEMRKQKVINSLKEKLHEATHANRELDAKLKKKEVELREMRSKATQLQREKGVLASMSSSSSAGFRNTQLNGGASARTRAMMSVDFGGQMRGNSGHAYGQRVNVMVKKCGALEMRAVKAEAELADANDLIEKLQREIEECRDRDDALCTRIENYESELAHLRPLPQLLRSARTDIKQLRRVVSASVSETAKVKGSLVSAEDDKFKLKSSNVELLQAKNKKDNKIFSLDEKLRALQEKVRTETAAKEKVIEETIKLEDRMAMLRKRCNQMEKSLNSERAMNQQLRKECSLKEEECELMATMVSSPSAIMRLGMGENRSAAQGKLQQEQRGGGTGDARDGEDNMQALLDALQNAELEASLNRGFVSADESSRPDDALEQRSVFVPAM